MNGTATTNFYLNMIDITDYSSVNMKNYSLPKKNYKAYFELIAKNNSQTNETNGDINFYYGNIAASSTGEQAVTYAQFIRIIQGNVGVTVKDFQITDDTIVSYMYITAGVVLDNLKFRFAILDENETNTDYEEHQQENNILPIQQEMLNGDYFELEEDGWKEVHGHYKKIFDGTENIGLTSNGNSFSYTASNPYIKYNTDQTVVLNFWSNRYTKATWNDRNYSNLPNTISSYGNVIGMDKGELSTADEFKQKLTEWKNNNDPLVVFYPLATPTKLACTEEQSAVLDKLNNQDLFKNTNNIITAEDIALLSLKYVADTKTYIDNQINERLSNIENQIVNLSGGN